MPTTEIQRIDPGSIFRMGLPIGATLGILGLVPYVFEFAAARSPGRAALDLLAIVLGSAISVAIVGVVLAIVYNLVAARYGGVSVDLSR